MQLSAIRHYYHAGAITGAMIHWMPITDSWAIELDLKPGVLPDDSVSLDTQRGHVRRFRTVDAAIRVLRDVGISRCDVLYDSMMR